MLEVSYVVVIVIRIDLASNYCRKSLRCISLDSKFLEIMLAVI